MGGGSRLDALRRRAAQVPATADRAVRHPRWFVETLRLARDRRRHIRTPFSLRPYREHFASATDAVAAVARVDAREAEAALADVWTPAAESLLGARNELLEILTALVRLLRPASVLETGVAEGFSTAVILKAMAQNGRGHLFSLDLPPLRANEEEYVGRAVAADLRDRWTLTLGPSRLVLPELADRAAPIDLFLHDADHTYASQLEEYRTAWPRLCSGAVLVSDDVCNPAFVEFAREAGARPYLVGRWDSANALGLLRKG